MPSDRDNPQAPRADGSPESPGSGRAESVGPGQTTEGGTLRQDAPPVWAMGEPPPASELRSGQGIYELNRELERSRTDGSDIAEGYELLRKLGTGAFGAVWEAQNRLTRERVAIKFFTAGAEEWASLLGEVGLLQTVEGCHGIVLVKEVRQGGPGRRPYYVMQLANCGSLSDWLKAASALPPRERLRAAVGFFTRVARAMAAVHRRGIHHCDLKPQNILLHAPEPGAAPEPLVADFGQAHFATDDTPSLGTFFYMPPDQIDAAQAGTPSDTRWDVYALGAICYEMLTGEPPRRTPELLDRIKKAPKHLSTKMAVYRDGLVAASAPAAHRAVADPMLAKIIDRCLSLDPEDRPADAGALLKLLDSRARWRRTRPVLALAAVATVSFLALLGLGSSLAAQAVTRESELNVTEELASSLARTAGYSVPAIERRLQFHVRRVEDAAEHPPDAVKEAMARLGRGPRGPRIDPASMPLADREAFAAWLGKIIADRKQAGLNADSVASLTLMLVADADAPGGSRGFVLARGNPDGTTQHVGNATRPDVFARDFSYRDYFHGCGSQVGVEGKPHAVIRATHICNPYKSQGDDVTSTGQRIVRPWKVDVVTPIWEDGPGSRVIGLLSFGLNLERDVVAVLEPADLGSRGSEHLNISRNVKVVLIDDRHQWVWHPDCRESLSADRPGVRLPHDYWQLAQARGRDPIQALPWTRITDPEAGRNYGYIEADDYVDFVEAERDDAGRNDKPEIACFTRFSPYAKSKYPEVRGRRWVFVAEVDRETALRPLNELRSNIVRIGAVIGSALVLLAVGLWIGLVTVLRRLEFAAHG
jgi:serine/threonine protein kinase